MKAIILLNTNTQAMAPWVGYKRGDRMENVYDLELDSMKSVDQALRTLFPFFNVDHPKGYSHRSLSVGDVVVLIADDWSMRSAFACQAVGWKQIPVPEFKEILAKEK